MGTKKDKLEVVWKCGATFLLIVGLARFINAGLFPATQALRGDFGATFPTGYFAKLRPDFPTDQVWGIAEGDWNYGPMLHFLTLPLLMLPTWSMVPKLWATANILALMASFIFIYRLVVKPGAVRHARVGMLVGLWFLYQPLINCLAQGNIEIMEMTMILGAFMLLRRGKCVSSGVLLGMAAMTKFLPVGFLVWLLVRRRLRAVAAGTITIALVAVVAAMTLGWSKSISLRSLAEGRGTDPVAGWHELSLTSVFVHRSSTVDWTVDPPNLNISPERRKAAVRVGLVVSTAVGLFYFLLFLARGRHPITAFDLAILFLLMFLLPSWNHDYYYLFGLVPISALFLQGVLSGSKLALGAMLLGYLLISPPVPFSWIDSMGWFPGRFAYVMNLNDVPVLGAIMLLLTSTYLMLREWLTSLGGIWNAKGPPVSLKR